MCDGPGLDGKPGNTIVTEELQHLVNRTRPNIARAVCVLSSYSKSPTQLHWRVGMQVVRYNVAVLAEISLQSPRKLLIYIITKISYRIKVSKNILI